MKNQVHFLRVIFSFLILLFFARHLSAQSTPMPTPPSGTNSVVFNSSTNEYFFNFNSETIYKYKIDTGSSPDQTGGTLHALTAKVSNENWFWPSNVGGIGAEFFIKPDVPVEKKPWDVGVTYSRLTVPTQIGNTVTSSWRMSYSGGFIEYEYKMTVSGKTLIINVEIIENYNATPVSFEFDRCENANEKRNVVIPYLRLFNILYSDDRYTSLFVDWEATNASTIYPLDPGEYTVPDYVSTKSARFAPKVRYNKKTNGQRNYLKETIYLTVSSDINEVLPNLVGPTAPRKAEAINRSILSYGPPYTWLFNPPSCSNYNYDYLTAIKNRGVNDLAVIIKHYQRLGFDSGYPAVLPANNFDGNNEPGSINCSNYDNPCLNTSTNSQLLINTKNSINALGYKVALHENYVDCYENGSSWFSWADCALKSDGTYLRNWPKGGCDHLTYSYVFNAGKAINYLSSWSDTIRSRIMPDWSYLDVHSGINPSDIVDYDASTSKDSAGYFKYVLHRYRQLPATLRTKYPGPIQGEGQCHFLYVGYFDDLEASLYTANYNIYGYKAPLLVDFDLLKMHSKSSYHGVGHYQTFFKLSPNTERTVSLTMPEILLNIATELAYGHGGLIDKANVEDLSIDQTVLENTHVLPVHKVIANAAPTSIVYYRNGVEIGTASQYIKTYSDWDNYDGINYMSQVKVTYNNGVIVCVNRNRANSWTINLGTITGWWSWNANVGSGTTQFAGNSTQSSFTLPPENGWVVYVPSGLMKMQDEEFNITEDVLPGNFVLHNNYPNPFNPETTIKFELPEVSHVRIVIYDVLGRTVANLYSGEKEAGTHALKWNGVNRYSQKISSGVYIARMDATSKSGRQFSKEIKMIMAK